MKESAREDKRNLLEERATATDKAPENGRNEELNSITKTTAGNRGSENCV